MRQTTTVVRERVGPWSASAYLALAARNFGWRRLCDIDRLTLKRLTIDADDRGVTRLPSRHTRDATCPICAVRRLTIAGFVRIARWPHARLVLPEHRAFLDARARRYEAFREDTPSGRAFYTALGYGEQWAAGRATVRASIARVRGVDPRHPFSLKRERLEE